MTDPQTAADEFDEAAEADEEVAAADQAVAEVERRARDEGDVDVDELDRVHSRRQTVRRLARLRAEGRELKAKHERERQRKRRVTELEKGLTSYAESNPEGEIPAKRDKAEQALREYLDACAAHNQRLDEAFVEACELEPEPGPMSQDVRLDDDRVRIEPGRGTIHVGGSTLRKVNAGLRSMLTIHRAFDPDAHQPDSLDINRANEHVIRLADERRGAGFQGLSHHRQPPREREGAGE